MCDEVFISSAWAQSWFEAAAVLSWTGDDLRDTQVAVRWSAGKHVHREALCEAAAGTAADVQITQVSPRWNHTEVNYSPANTSLLTQEVHDSGHLLLSSLVHEHHQHSDWGIIQSWKNTLKNIVCKNLASKKDVKMSFNLCVESARLVPHDGQWLVLNHQQLQKLKNFVNSKGKVNVVTHPGFIQGSL